MAQATFDAEDDSSAQDQEFALETLEVDALENNTYEHTVEVHDRETAVNNGSEAARYWTALASQQDGDVDVARDDEKVLVAVGLYGWWVNENEWSDRWNREYPIGFERRGGYGRIESGHGKGLEWTLAVIDRDEDTESGFAELEGSPVYQFGRMKGKSGEWGPSVDQLTAPKAGTLIMYPTGEPTELDEEKVEYRDGWPEKEDGFGRDQSVDWNYQRALDAARDRIEDRKERERYTPKHEDILADIQEDYGSEGAFAVEFGGQKGENAFTRFDDVDPDNIDPRKKDAIIATAAGTVKAMFELVDDPDALRENLSCEGGEDEGE